jgi:hypothetical protein
MAENEEMVGKWWAIVTETKKAPTVKTISA